MEDPCILHTKEACYIGRRHITCVYKLRGRLYDICRLGGILYTYGGSMLHTYEAFFYYV